MSLKNRLKKQLSELSQDDFIEIMVESALDHGFDFTLNDDGETNNDEVIFDSAEKLPDEVIATDGELVEDKEPTYYNEESEDDMIENHDTEGYIQSNYINDTIDKAYIKEISTNDRSMVNIVNDTLNDELEYLYKYKDKKLSAINDNEQLEFERKLYLNSKNDIINMRYHNKDVAESLCRINNERDKYEYLLDYLTSCNARIAGATHRDSLYSNMILQNAFINDFKNGLYNPYDNSSN